MRNKSKSKRTEAALSLLVTSALVITLAIAVASAIKKGTTNDQKNIVNLNETESNLSADNSSQQNTNETPAKTPSDTTKSINQTKTADAGSNTDTDTTRSGLHASLEEEIADDTSDTETDLSANDTSDVPVVSDNSVNAGYSFSEADTLKMPVAGEIVLEYNMDNTIWFPTLGVYKCNPGIYIAQATGTDVIASASGTVESITVNEELGNIVTINMGNGYKASYGQLGDIKVSEGEVVLSGSVIGTVADPTIYYTMEGSGVYFKLTRNDVPENPLDYME